MILFQSCARLFESTDFALSNQPFENKVQPYEIKYDTIKYYQFKKYVDNDCKCLKVILKNRIDNKID